MSLNKVILIGRLTKDPELRHTDSGKAVCNFSVAIDNGYGENRSTDFINCVAWNKTAEFVSKYFAKGKMIIVIGRISTRMWEGQDGKKNYITEVVASEVSFGAAALKGQPGELSLAEDSRENGDYKKEVDKTSNLDEFMPIDDYDDMPFN